MLWKRKWKRKPPEERYIEVSLDRALEGHVDKILYGEPCDNLPRVTLKAAMAADPEWGAAMAKLIGLSDELCPEAKGVPMFPVWWRIDGVWHEMGSLPWHLLHGIVRHIGELIYLHQTAEQRNKSAEKMESTVRLKKLGRNGGIAKVSLELTLEPNYCYSVTLKKVD
jgi:hypothetical protein